MVPIWIWISRAFSLFFGVPGRRKHLRQGHFFHFFNRHHVGGIGDCEVRWVLWFHLSAFQKDCYKIVEIPNLITIKEEFSDATITQKNIVYLGRLNKTKGIDLLIKAFSKLHNTDVNLLIAGGDNAYKIELESLVNSLRGPTTSAKMIKIWDFRFFSEIWSTGRGGPGAKMLLAWEHWNTCKWGSEVSPRGNIFQTQLIWRKLGGFI